MYDTYTSTAAPPADDGMTESASARGSRPVSVVESSIPRKSEEESDGMSRVTGMLTWHRQWIYVSFLRYSIVLTAAELRNYTIVMTILSPEKSWRLSLWNVGTMLIWCTSESFRNEELQFWKWHWTIVVWKYLGNITSFAQQVFDMFKIFRVTYQQWKALVKNKCCVSHMAATNQNLLNVTGVFKLF